MAARNLTDVQRTWGTTLSALNLLAALALAELEGRSGWRLYQDQLGQAGLSLTIGSGPHAGVSVSGRF